MSDRDPERWLRSASAEEGPLASLLDAGRAEKPSAAQLSALATRLEPTFSKPPSGGGGGGGGGGAASTAMAGTSLAPLALGALLVLGIATAWLSSRGADRSTPAALSPAKPVSTAPPAPPSAPAPRPLLPAAPSAEPVVVDAAPTPELAAPAEAATPTKPRAIERAQDPAAELALLEDAHRALAAEARRTLELSEAHRRRFPHGQYEQEREVLAIEALLALDERARASTRAAHFLTHHPESSHARRVRALLAESEKVPASDTGAQRP